jgi:hypothetical protein
VSLTHDLHVLIRNTRSPSPFHPSWVTTSRVVMNSPATSPAPYLAIRS